MAQEALEAKRRRHFTQQDDASSLRTGGESSGGVFSASSGWMPGSVHISSFVADWCQQDSQGLIEVEYKTAVRAIIDILEADHKVLIDTPGSLDMKSSRPCHIPWLKNVGGCSCDVAVVVAA